MPESLFREPNNIAQMIGYESKEQPLSIEREIPPEAWDWLIGAVTNGVPQDDNEFSNRAQLLMCALVLDRNRLFTDGRFTIHDLQVVNEYFTRLLAGYAAAGEWLSYTSNVTYLRVLDPRVGTSLTEEQYESLANYLSQVLDEHQSGSVEVFLSNAGGGAVALLHASPDKFEQTGIRERLWPLLCDYIARISVDNWAYLDCVINAKVLYPDKHLPTVSDSEMTKYCLAMIRDNLGESDEERFIMFGYAATLKMAIARRLTLTEQGLVIESHDQFSTDPTSQLPDQRHY